MIFNGIILAFYSLIFLLSAPIRLLPSVTIPASFASAMDTASGYLTAVNSFIPVDTILLLLNIFVGIEIAYLTYKFIMWVVKRFPTQS